MLGRYVWRLEGCAWSLESHIQSLYGTYGSVKGICGRVLMAPCGGMWGFPCILLEINNVINWVVVCVCGDTLCVGGITMFSMPYIGGIAAMNGGI